MILRRLALWLFAAALAGALALPVRADQTFWIITAGPNLPPPPSPYPYTLSGEMGGGYLYNYPNYQNYPCGNVGRNNNRCFPGRMRRIRRVPRMPRIPFAPGVPFFVPRPVIAYPPVARHT